MNDKGKKILFTIMSIALAVVFVLGAGEAVIRLKNMSMTNYDVEMWRYARELKTAAENPVLGHRHIPSKSAVLQSTEIRINAEGLRGPEITPLADGGRRILFLGSSITLGWGVPEDKIMTTLIADKFHAAGQDKVQVLNAGIGNYNAKRYVTYFFDDLAKLKPTDIVVHYFINDAETLEQGGGNFFIEHSQLALTMWIAANRFLFREGEAGIEKHYKDVYEPSAPGYMDMVASLTKLAEYAKKNGIRLYLAAVPDIHVLNNYPYTYIQDRMRDLSAKLGYRFIDLLPAFKGTEPKDLWAMPGDPHPNALGHERMADAIYPVLAAD